MFFRVSELSVHTYLDFLDNLLEDMINFTLDSILEAVATVNPNLLSQRSEAFFK